jgi:hypothetical protein
MATFEIHYGFNDFICGNYIHAIYSGDMGKVKELLVAGQDPFERDSGGNTPYFWASFHGDAEMIQAIADAQLQRGGIQGLEPWHVKMAIPIVRPLNAEQMRRFKLLFELVPDQEALKAAAPDLLSEAVFHGADADVVQFLLAAGIAPTHHREKTGDTPFHDACRQGRTDSLKLLLETATDINPLNDCGETPLRCAVNAFLVSGLAEAGECIQLLLRHKACVIPPLRLGERFSLWTRQ